MLGVFEEYKVAGKFRVGGQNSKYLRTTDQVSFFFFTSNILLPKLNSSESGTREQKEEAIRKALYFYLKE